MDVQSGTLDLGGIGGVGTGQFVTEAGATLAFGDPFANFVGGYTLAASSTVTGAGAVSFENGATEVDGTFAPSRTVIAGAGVNFGHAITLASLSLLAGTLTDLGTVTVTGPLNWTGGVMQGPGTTVARGGLFINPSSFFASPTLDGRTLVNAGPATLSGSGQVLFSNNAVLDNAAGATFVLAPGASIFTQFQAAPRFVNHGTVRVDAAGTPAMVGAAFTNLGKVVVAAGGALDVTGTFTNYSPATQTLTGGTYLVSGAFQFSGGDLVTNAANLTLNGPSAQVLSQFGGNALANLAVNRSSGSLTVRGGANFSTGAAFTNLGRVAVGAGSSFTTAGTYTQAGGSTALGGGSLTATAVLIQAGLLSGPGTVNGDVTNSGKVAPGGVGAVGLLTINGNYTQTSTGVLSIDLGGAQAGQYDRLAVTGQATLGGTLAVQLVHGYAPRSGDSLRILTFASESGNFVTEKFPAMSGGLSFHATLDATGLTLSVS